MNLVIGSPHAVSTKTGILSLEVSFEPLVSKIFHWVFNEIEGYVKAKVPQEGAGCTGLLGLVLTGGRA